MPYKNYKICCGCNSISTPSTVRIPVSGYNTGTSSIWSYEIIDRKYYIYTDVTRKFKQLDSAPTDVSSFVVETNSNDTWTDASSLFTCTIQSSTTTSVTVRFRLNGGTSTRPTAATLTNAAEKTREYAILNYSIITYTPQVFNKIACNAAYNTTGNVDGVLISSWTESSVSIGNYKYKYSASYAISNSSLWKNLTLTDYDITTITFPPTSRDMVLCTATKASDAANWVLNYSFLTTSQIQFSVGLRSYVYADFTYDTKDINPCIVKGDTYYISDSDISLEAVEVIESGTYADIHTFYIYATSNEYVDVDVSFSGTVTTSSQVCPIPYSNPYDYYYEADTIDKRSSNEMILGLSDGCDVTACDVTVTMSYGGQTKRITLNTFRVDDQRE